MESSYTTKAQLRSSLQRVAGKIDSAEDKIDVLFGVANGISTRVEGVEGDISSLQTQVDGISVPTKTSELTNDSGYIKSVNGKSANAAGSVLLVPPDIGAASNPNLLDNWYFADPINQKRKAEYTSNGYTIDRWKFVSFATGGVQIQNEGIVLTTGNENENNYFFQCYDFDRIHLLSGKTVTASLLYKASGNCAMYNKVNGVDIDNYITLINDGLVHLTYHTFTIPGVITNSNNEIFGTKAFKNSQLTLIAAKLELGSKQTLAHQNAFGGWVLNDPPPNKQQELAKCQRYMLVLPDTNDLNPVIGVGIAYETDKVVIAIPIPSTMRTRPAVTAVGNWIIQGSGSYFGFDAASRQCFVYNISSNVVNINITGFSGLSYCHAYTLQRHNNATAEIIFDANL